MDEILSLLRPLAAALPQPDGVAAAVTDGQAAPSTCGQRRAAPKGRRLSFAADLEQTEAVAKALAAVAPTTTGEVPPSCPIQHASLSV